MKKTYQQPQAFITVLAPQTIMAGSAKGTSVFDQDASAENTVLTRHFNSLWEDDEDEEDW